jgi:hypothetical protein
MEEYYDYAAACIQSTRSSKAEPLNYGFEWYCAAPKTRAFYVRTQGGKICVD